MSNPILAALERIKALKAILAEVPETWSPRNAPAKQIQWRQAEEEIESILNGYKKLLTGELTKIYVTGSDKKKLAEFKLLATELPGAVAVDADALYRRITTPAVPLYEQTKKFSNDVALVIENDIMTAAQMNNVTPNDFPHVAANYLESTFEDPEASILKIVRETVEKVAGTEMQQNMLTQFIFSEALRLEVSEVPVFVVIVGIKENEIVDFERRGFFGGRPQVVVNLDTAKNFEGALRSATNKLAKAFDKASKPVEQEVPPATDQSTPPVSNPVQQ